ncbi:MAG TPA: enoyl-CoA hydratase-related protein [Pyrinomonadaceae bacterium]|jgi:enoyl-CoA hydratase|nr:enoyl-CoA hydratase-related protein [Pyrinomonadaceae bacterium]
MVIFELRGRLAVVRLNHPERMNALSRRALNELDEAFERVEREQGVHTVILTGTGERAFSAGTDIKELASLDEEGARDAAKRGQHLCNRIEHCSVPVIAAVNGLAAGGGCELALACHLRIASTHARFSLPETKLGLIPAYGGTQRLARIIGTARASEMMLTGATMSAEEAHRAGLVNRVVPPEHLLTEAESLAGEIAKLAPLAIRACLRAVVRGLLMPLEDGLALEAELFSGLFSTEDMREGTRAFLEKRAPVFKGK